MPISPITLILEGAIEFPMQESERNPNKSSKLIRSSVLEWISMRMKITMRQLLSMRLGMVTTLSFAPVEDFLDGFEGVDIEDIHVGAGLIGFKVVLVLTFNRILFSLDLFLWFAIVVEGSDKWRVSC